MARGGPARVWEDATMARRGTRRTFLKEASTSAAALAALSASRADAGVAGGPGGTPYLCVTCGTQFTESARPPARCPICEDERQYVHPDGQKWTTLEELRASHQNVIQKDGGNVLWDCVGLIDDATISRINELGGIAEIAISHPHYYTAMVEFSRAFGG